MTAHYFWQEFTEGSGHVCKTQLQHSTVQYSDCRYTETVSASDSAQKRWNMKESKLQITYYYYYPTHCVLLLLTSDIETKN